LKKKTIAILIPLQHILFTALSASFHPEPLSNRKRHKMEFTDILPYLIISAGLVTLLTLSIIDLKTWLLPNKLNITLAILGLAFHASLHFSLFEPIDLIFGALLGAGTLLTIRFFGNKYYGQDTLGLGDVKLLGAAGLWLGMEGVVLAMTIGAFMGILHGIGVALYRAAKEKTKPNMKRLMIPAGPGFCLGIAISGFWTFFDKF
jgi:leader peptidase (prepilin peptidase) / N-methyltransferase